MLKKIFLLVSCYAFVIAVHAQYIPQFKVDVTATENYFHSFDDFQFLVEFDTQSPISSGDMKTDGSDIRFGNECLDMKYNYWIESGINSPTTRIWVHVTNVNANDQVSIFMFYGDSLATAESDFNATFPNSFVSTGNYTLTGDTTIGWLEIQLGDTLFLTGGVKSNIYASHVEIAGVISGDGKGFAAAPTPGPATGGGPGGGSASSNSGAGGGSYGGVGGTGGFDSGDTPGVGGVTYGNRKTVSIEMGSAGGTAPSIIGGNGGGGVAIYAQEIQLTGSISVNGFSGTMPGAPQGAAGGAGGGVLLVAESINFSGSINAEGGDGSVGTSTANDDGGGGGGGRVKLFKAKGNSASGTISVAGGTGGPNGGTPAQNGMPGTILDTSFTFTSVQSGSQSGASAIDPGVAYTGFELMSNTPGATYQWLDCSSSPATALTGDTARTLVLSGNGSYQVVITKGACSDTSACVNVTNFTADEFDIGSLKIYPNPVNDILKIDIPGEMDDLEFNLYTRTGQELLRGVITRQSPTIDITELNKGAYILVVKDGKEQRFFNLLKM